MNTLSIDFRMSPPFTSALPPVVKPAATTAGGTGKFDLASSEGSQP